jgi:predicted DNA-binding transcriptional regulator YafY
MRRADRLFQIVQFLRSRRLTTAEWLAERLQVSKRTIYRDITDLSLSGVPVEGEAGVGYVLRQKMDLPPLCFDRDELTAMQMGLRFVHAYTDEKYSLAASSAMAKIKAATQGTVSEDLPKSQVFIPLKMASRSPLMAVLVTAIDAQQKVQIDYCSEIRQKSHRIIWPLGLFFWGQNWTLLSWCELREDFRSFRLDRIEDLLILDAVYQPQPHQRMPEYFRQMEEKYGPMGDDADPLDFD